MTMKIILSLIFVLLTGCLPIRVIPKYNPDVYNHFKTIQAIQKRDTIGHTDVRQREVDLYACGVRNLFDGNLDLNTQYPEMTDTQMDDRRNSIYTCIESKGYIIRDPINCTVKGKPNGFCN